ncbi:MAG: NADH dehydrogenase (quinone) subunit D [Solirubrobacteraceae bacterium]|nr:NADH dehydrogenase (quinone) subunit D [Solirubrobacteraceae bacterium]
MEVTDEPTARPAHREHDAPAAGTDVRERGADIADRDDRIGGPSAPAGAATATAEAPASVVPGGYRAHEASIDFSSQLGTVATQDEAELLTINMGPHHPATHGVLRLLTTLEGEVVRDVKPIVGYLHTGIEKTCEDKAYWKAIPLVERMDYLAYYFNAMAYCGAVEDLLECEVPKRAQYLRVIHLELNRIMSHLVWLGTTALDIGAMSILWYSFRERETILDLFEYSSGQRMHTRYFQIGGVAEDIPGGWEQSLRRFVREMPKRLDQYSAMLTRNEIFLSRMKHTGVAPAATLQAKGVTGPLLRAAGVPWDLRKAMPYSSYDDFDFQVPVGTEGDNYDRYLVRMAEMRESVRIIEQAIDGLPEGPWITTDRKVALPPRHELATSMEALIHHFKLVTEGMRVPAGEAYHAIEGPRGELGCFVRSDGSSKPARVHMRDSSFINLQALEDMCRGGYIADMIATLACLDPLLGGIDR